MRVRRSGCPINLTLETFGDRWSLIILRDAMFGGRRRSFRSFLTESVEGIASNILSDRLQRLTATGLLTRSPDPGHKQRVLYSLTESAIELVPLMAFMGSWGIRHARPSLELSRRAQGARRRRTAALGRVHGRVAAYPSGRARTRGFRTGQNAGGLSGRVGLASGSGKEACRTGRLSALPVYRRYPPAPLR